MTAAGRLAASLLIVVSACFEGAMGQQPQARALNVPFLVDTATVRRLNVFYTAAPLPDDKDEPQLACLLGSVDSTAIIVDSIRVADHCDAQPQVIGVLGARKVTDYWTDQEVDAYIANLCRLLVHSPYHVVGVIHALVPVPENLMRPGMSTRAPLVWACWRP